MTMAVKVPETLAHLHYCGCLTGSNASAPARKSASHRSIACEPSRPVKALSWQRVGGVLPSPVIRKDDGTERREATLVDELRIRAVDVINASRVSKAVIECGPDGMEIEAVGASKIGS